MARVRIATYNIHGTVGRDGRGDIGRIARVINELGADVVALQEVLSRTGDEDTLAFLHEATGLRALAGSTMLRGDGSYGNALLSRGELVEVRRIDLSMPDREPRGALDVRLDCQGTPLRVMATHLGLRPAERRHQIRVLLSHLRSAPDGPIVLLGDLNEWFLWGRPLRWLRIVFPATPAPATFPSGFPLLALDRLWVHPAGLLRELRVHTTALARVASDHLPLVGTVDVPRAQPHGP